MNASPTTTSTDGETIRGCRGFSGSPNCSGGPRSASAIARSLIKIDRRYSKWNALPPKERNGHEGAEYDNPSTNQRWVHLPGDSRARIAANDGSDEHDPSLCPRHFSRSGFIHHCEKSVVGTSLGHAHRCRHWRLCGRANRQASEPIFDSCWDYHTRRLRDHCVLSEVAHSICCSGGLFLKAARYRAGASRTAATVGRA